MPLFIWIIVAAIVAVLVSVTAAAFMMTSQSKGKKQDDFKVAELPTTEVGKTIPVLWGTRLITNPSVAWWGDLKVLKVKMNTAGKK